MAAARGPYLLGWRAWTLWIIPILATALFAWILLVALGTVETPTVEIRTWVMTGMVVFVTLLVLELLLLIKRKTPEESASGPQPDPGDTVVPYAPPVRADRIEVEYASTEEQYKGMRVLEMSIPPKSRNKGGVYAKSYVSIAGDMVLRVEDLVADTRDVPPVAA